MGELMPTSPLFAMNYYISIIYVRRHKMNKADYELFPGSREMMKDFWKNPDEKLAWEERYHKDVVPALQEFDRKHAESEREARTRRID